jgi:hypothetical protein
VRRRRRRRRRRRKIRRRKKAKMEGTIIKENGADCESRNSN